MKDLEDLKLGDIDYREVVTNGVTSKLEVALIAKTLYDSSKKKLGSISSSGVRLYSYDLLGLCISEEDKDGNILATYEYKHKKGVFGPVKKIRRNRKGDIQYVEAYEYDSDDNLKKTTSIVYDDGIAFCETWEDYIYNKDGKLKRKDYYDGDDNKLYCSYTYTYDSAGNLKREDSTDGDYTEYNSDGYEIYSHREYDLDGRSYSWFEYLTDEKGVTTQYEFCDAATLDE